VSKTGSVSTPFMFNDPGSNINPKEMTLEASCGRSERHGLWGALYMLGEADIIIAAEHATFFDPHVSYGMVAGSINASIAKVAAGRNIARCAARCPRTYVASRAHQLGLVPK